MFGVQYLVFGVRSWRSAVPSDDGCIQAIHNTTFSPFITTHPDDIAFLWPWGYGCSVWSGGSMRNMRVQYSFLIVECYLRLTLFWRFFLCSMLDGNLYLAWLLIVEWYVRYIYSLVLYLLGGNLNWENGVSCDTLLIVVFFYVRWTEIVLYLLLLVGKLNMVSDVIHFWF